MDIQLQAHVMSADGTELGHIDKVIFDPRTGETTAIVIHQGGIFGRDVAVEVGHIRVATPAHVEVDLNREQVEGSPDFVERDYMGPPATWVPPYGWAPESVLWPLGAGDFAYPVVTGVPPDEERTEDEEAVVVRGSDVLASGGEKVGTVRNVVVDTETHRPSRVIMRRGLVFAEEVELPGSWVASVEDHALLLNVDKATVERQPKLDD